LIKEFIIGLISVLVVASCAVDKTGFILRHRKKNINLTSITDQHKIGYETDSAIIFIGQNDGVQLIENLLSERRRNFDNKLNSELKLYLDFIKKIQSDTVVQHWGNRLNYNEFQTYDLAGFIDQWLLKDLILKGKTEIWNKSTKKPETRVTYHFVKDKLGGKACYFTFQSGSKFHSQIITLGE
jgi:hypothetical protein